MWKVKVKSLSRVWLLVTPWTAAYQTPLPMGFSRQEYWSGPQSLISYRQKWDSGSFLTCYITLSGHGRPTEPFLICRFRSVQTNWSWGSSSLLYVSGTWPDMPNACKVIGRNSWPRYKIQTSTATFWTQLKFLLSFSRHAKYLFNRFLLCNLVFHSCNALCCCYFREKCLQFTSWSFL